MPEFKWVEFKLKSWGLPECTATKQHHLSKGFGYKGRYSFPRINDLLDQVRGTEFFSKMEFKLGYYQAKIKEEDTFKTTFRMHYENYEFVLVSFGLTNTPATLCA